MNSYLAVSCLLAFAGVASAFPGGYGGSLGYVNYATVDKIANPNYGFNYAVNDPSTGDNKAQWETRDGDFVKGAYSLVEPDGNVRVVEYTADPLRGFNAVVKRTGPNVHSVSAIAPVITPVITKHIESVPIAPITPLAHTQVITPIIDAPIIAPIPTWDYPEILPYYPLPAPSPWVHLSGNSYGHKGNLVRSWEAGPISLDGKTLTIRTKH